ncbi:hypothetical protein JCM33374_g3315 [Metschnikowia sp. JCM 33374]|nr:hypothetical protein JCM33374_g3315 [Metschnikowia sp. JCM 33374]
MPLSIVIPDDVNLYHTQNSSALGPQTHTPPNEEAPRDMDWDSFYWSLCKSSTRRILFYEEKFTGYAVHTCPLGSQLPPSTIFLTSTSIHDHFPDPARVRDSIQPVINVQQSPNRKKNDEVAKKEVRTVPVTDLLWQGQSGVLSDPPVNVSIWKFVASAGCPHRETTGQLELSVSLENPYISAETSSGSTWGAPLENPDPLPEKSTETSHKSVVSGPPASESPNYKVRSENLLEELNHGIRKKPAQKYQLFYAAEDPVSVKGQGSPRRRDHQTKTMKTTATAAEVTKSKLNSSKNSAAEHEELSSRLQNRLSLGLEDDHQTHQVSTSAPLQLRLRTTRAGGRMDFLLTTLRIEAPDSLVAFSKTRKQEKYALHILGLETEFKGGQITQLGEMDFPRRCDLNDIINLTYKLVNNEIPEPFSEVSSDSSSSSGSGSDSPCPSGSGMSKPLVIKVRVRVEKTDVSGICDETEWVQVTDEISTTWMPILDFDGTVQAPNHPVRVPTPQGIQQSQFRSKSTNLKPSQPVGAYAKKSVTIKSFSSSSALSNPSSPYSGRPAWAVPASSTNLRPSTPSKSSPLLSVSRNGGAKKKLQRNIISQCGASSSLVVNLASDISAVLSGLRLTFTGNPRVDAGRIITWKVQAINQTNRLLKLTLTANPVKKQTVSNPYSYSFNGSARSSSYTTLASTDEKKASNGPSIQSRLQLYEQYNACKREKPGVVLLSNDVGLGILEPNQVFESEFSFICLSKGIFNLNGLRLVESSTGEVVEIGRLLEVYVA